MSIGSLASNVASVLAESRTTRHAPAYGSARCRSRRQAAQMGRYTMASLTDALLQQISGATQGSGGTNALSGLGIDAATASRGLSAAVPLLLAAPGATNEVWVGHDS